MYTSLLGTDLLSEWKGLDSPYAILVPLEQKKYTKQYLEMNNSREDILMV